MALNHQTKSQAEYCSACQPESEPEILPASLQFLKSLRSQPLRPIVPENIMGHSVYDLGSVMWTR
jgi:hypothetical protein